MQTQSTSIPSGLTGAIQRVLVVDDSRAQLKMVETMVRRWGYEVMTADSGHQALEIVRRTPPDLILSDWMMPGMTGLEFCRHFRGLSQNGYGYFILLTSKSEKGDIAKGLDAGADDFLTKPVNAHELRARIKAGERIVSMERQLSEKNRQVSDALEELREIHTAIDNDLRQARTIQQSLVPERICEVLTSRVSLLLRPCGHVGGDLVGVFKPGFGRLGLYSIDVSGHGITSAMVTARVAGYLSSTFPEQNVALERRFDRFYAMREPAETAQMLNQRLAADPGVEEYLTMAYVAADLASGRMRMVQAGHSPPLLLRADGSHDFIGDGGLPIGLVDEVSYDQHDFQLQSGDRLLLYSDGFTEAVMKNGEMLGDDGLVEIFRESARTGSGPDLLEDMFWRLTQQMESAAKLGDDVSAALLEYDVLRDARA
ncbi:sigma-B regulation protein RsbU (phosphoserine phosphatase) [Mameliella alba]|uniref:PP2C family protein-serine/threonine phosphatase n=1 Tax=Mameliella TaxID=1434019 RepID=UPI00084102F3|nr:MULTISPECIES: fused response regulator/phosphatase [Mameliella]ODM45884.1 fused response regulator/phosphatase [Ruegeria sp. PBVC088]MDD9732126.1 fused response regulator/phosphatase [Mameliella sp. AT18]PTR38067.1 sigma-B regulation protein RsbU (phosphoserine phosphatase) [Mameliella alba]SDD57354.1 sigma-B regulation protein RsbU (phosphoserine phosphatase) [Mameliella alba]GGF68014.1 fused response regulator/phosphatase [Mameliella alba]